MIDWTPKTEPNGKPRYIAIADAIETDIRDGRLSPGNRLPPHHNRQRQGARILLSRVAFGLNRVMAMG